MLRYVKVIGLFSIAALILTIDFYLVVNEAHAIRNVSSLPIYTATDFDPQPW